MLDKYRRKAPAQKTRRLRGERARPCVTPNCGNFTLNKNQLCWVHKDNAPLATNGNHSHAPHSKLLPKMLQTFEGQQPSNATACSLGLLDDSDNIPRLVLNGMETGCSVWDVMNTADLLELGDMPPDTCIVVPSQDDALCNVVMQHTEDGSRVTVVSRKKGRAINAHISGDDLRALVE